MNDLVILLVIAAWAVLLAGYVVVCDRVGR